MVFVKVKKSHNLQENVPVAYSLSTKFANWQATLKPILEATEV